MARSVRPVIVVLLLVTVTVAVSGHVGAVEEGASMTMTVNGETIDDGDHLVVDDANISIRVVGDTALSTVVVRVNGADAASYSPSGSTFERDLDPDLRARDNRIQIIATDANDGTTSLQATIYKDTVPPAIGLSSPFTVEPGYVFPRNVTDAEANVSLAGTVQDASNVTEFEARIVGDGAVETTELENDSSFSLNTTLGPGNSTVVIEAEDEYGNERRVRTRLLVEDESAPEIDIIDWPENGTTSDSITVRVHATDDVGLESLTLRQDGLQDRVLLEPSPNLFDRGRDVVERNVTLRLPREGVNDVTINATDTANHSTVIVRSVEYDPVTPEEAAVPEFQIDEQDSGFVDEQTYHLNATVTNGSVRTVVVESSARPSDRVLSYGKFYDGTERKTVDIDRDVAIEPGVNVVRIRATDEFGTVHDRRLRVDTRNESHRLATTTPTTVSTERPTTTDRKSTPVAKVTAENEPPLDPVSKTSIPLSPATVVIGVLLTALLLGRRAETS